jgi:hypothetical protein
VKSLKHDLLTGRERLDASWFCSVVSIALCPPDGFAQLPVASIPAADAFAHFGRMLNGEGV